MNIKSKLKTTGFQIKEIAHSISDISQGAQVAPTGIKYLLQPLDEIDIKEIKAEFGVDARYNWQCFYTDDTALVTYSAGTKAETQNRFIEFVGTPPPKGLGTTPGRLRQLAHVLDDTELEKVVKDLLPAVARHGEIGNGRSRGVNNTSTEDRGTSAPDYITARLKRDRPELAEKVVNGEISAHEAAVQAGIRKKYVSVRCDPEGFAKKILDLFDEDERQYIADNII